MLDLIKIGVLILSLMVCAPSWAGCAEEMLTETPATKIVRAVKLSQELKAKETTTSPQQMVEWIFTLSEGFRAGSHPTLTYAEAIDFARELKLFIPSSREFRLNLDLYRNQWIRENVLAQVKLQMLELADALIKHPAGWNERVRLFKKFIEDPRLEANPQISVYALDPLLGLPSVDLSEAERQSGEISQKDDPRDGQRKFIGFAPENVWSHYTWIHRLLRMGKIKPAQQILDIGSGIGRTGLYVAAMYPQVRFLGLELMPSRMRAAQAVVDRFALNQRIEFRQADLKNEDLPSADHYFFFNSLGEKAYQRLLQTLKTRSRTQSFFLYSVFDEFDSFSQQSWLSEVDRYPISSWKIIKDDQSGEITTRLSPWDMKAYLAVP